MIDASLDYEKAEEKWDAVREGEYNISELK